MSAGSIVAMITALALAVVSVLAWSKSRQAKKSKKAYKDAMGEMRKAARTGDVDVLWRYMRDRL